MHSDMHFYGTYALARAAGIVKEDAKTVAYSAQFVDDSTKQDSKQHADGGLLYGIATARSFIDCVPDAQFDPEQLRRVWVPFHFLPGGIGDTLEEKLICVRDSEIANEMVEHHIELAKRRKNFGLELLGIAAHTYMDTFAHYGFSGISSGYNGVKGASIERLGNISEATKNNLEEKFQEFFKRFPTKFWDFVASEVAERVSHALGHGGVGTYPDQPFLHWRFEFEMNRPGNGDVSDRDNPLTYLDACEKMHGYFSKFAKSYYAEAQPKKFGEIKNAVEDVLRFEGEKKERIERWKKAIREKIVFDSEADEHGIHYDAADWEKDKDEFAKHSKSSDGIKTHIYRFHQAAAIHRYYVLKDLLPAHGVSVY